VKRLALVLSLTLAVAACGKPPEVAVEDVWARATVGEQANAAVFMTITSPTGDRLVSASAPVAGKTDLMTMQGGSEAMEMAYVEDILIPVRAPVHLEPSGLHVWLADLKQPLRNGESFPLTLEFEKAGKREVRVAVIGPAAPPPMSGMGM
jgi:copper(I)-binding protein